MIFAGFYAYLADHGMYLFLKGLSKWNRPFRRP